MIKSLLAEGNFVVTAEMTVRYKKPAYSGDDLHFEGWKTEHRGVLFLTEGRAVNQKGETVAEASGKYIKPNSSLTDKLLDSLE
jgi:acyl-CoA thioesterase FadM